MGQGGPDGRGGRGWQGAGGVGVGLVKGWQGKV